MAVINVYTILLAVVVSIQFVVAALGATDWETLPAVDGYSVGFTSTDPLGFRCDPVRCDGELLSDG